MFLGIWSYFLYNYCYYSYYSCNLCSYWNRFKIGILQNLYRYYHIHTFKILDLLDHWIYHSLSILYIAFTWVYFQVGTKKQLNVVIFTSWNYLHTYIFFKSQSLYLDLLNKWSLRIWWWYRIPNQLDISHDKSIK